MPKTNYYMKSYLKNKKYNKTVWRDRKRDREIERERHAHTKIGIFNKLKMYDCFSHKIHLVGLCGYHKKETQNQKHNKNQRNKSKQ